MRKGYGGITVALWMLGIAGALIAVVKLLF